MLKHKRQRGFTITELMITVTLGLSVISSVMIGYLATYKGSMGTLAMSKLTQDMNSTMELMVSELRRAGYSAETSLATSPSTNTFNVVNNTALAVYNTVASNTKQGSQGSGACIIYSYDLDADGTVDTNEVTGFRLNGGKVQMRTVGVPTAADTCAGANDTWSDVTDSSFMTVTALTFNLATSVCLNNREPDSVDNNASGTTDEAAESDCYTTVPSAGNITIETRVVGITLTANLTNDSFVTSTLNETVRVRNDWIRVR